MSPKVLNLNELIERIQILRGLNKMIVFTNGCFDILHTGHIQYLAAARSNGDVLIVGLNSDSSVTFIKGDKRPIVCQKQRAEVLASLWCVDYVTIFDEPDPYKLIYAIKPDFLVKGDDWTEDKIIGADIVKADGGRVIRVPVVPEISTSIIIQRIVDRYG